MSVKPTKNDYFHPDTHKTTMLEDVEWALELRNQSQNEFLYSTVVIENSDDFEKLLSNTVEDDKELVFVALVRQKTGRKPNDYFDYKGNAKQFLRDNMNKRIFSDLEKEKLINVVNLHRKDKKAYRSYNSLNKIIKNELKLNFKIVSKRDRRSVISKQNGKEIRNPNKDKNYWMIVRV